MFQEVLGGLHWTWRFLLTTTESYSICGCQKIKARIVWQLPIWSQWSMRELLVCLKSLEGKKGLKLNYRIMTSLLYEVFNGYDLDKSGWYLSVEGKICRKIVTPCKRNLKESKSMKHEEANYCLYISNPCQNYHFFQSICHFFHWLNYFCRIK